jgi:hypothetical protein
MSMHRLLQEFDSLPDAQKQRVIQEFKRESMQDALAARAAKPATHDDVRKLIQRYNTR